MKKSFIILSVFISIQSQASVNNFISDESEIRPPNILSVLRQPLIKIALIEAIENGNQVIILSEKSINVAGERKISGQLIK